MHACNVYTAGGHILLHATFAPDPSATTKTSHLYCAAGLDDSPPVAGAALQLVPAKKHVWSKRTT